MFALLLPILWQSLAKMAFSVLVTAAQKTGVINKVEASVIRTEHDAVSAIENLKTYPEYPTGKNGESAQQQQSVSNITVGRDNGDPQA